MVHFGTSSEHSISEDSSAPLLAIQMFGPMVVRIQGNPLPPLRSRRGFYLLALLTLRAEREVERRWLAGHLWPDSPDDLGLTNLRRTLADLRVALGPAVNLLEASTQQRLRLRLPESGPEQSRADVLLFDRAVEQSDFPTALSVYTGSLFEGCDEDWLLQERERRTQQFLTAAETLGREQLLAGNFAEAIQIAKRAIAADPLRESVWRLEIEALLRGGNLAEAGEIYRNLRTHLRRELNANPDPATTELYEGLKREITSRASIPSATVAVSPQPTPTAPAPDKPSVGQTHLPVFLSSFVGREAERQHVVTLLQEPQARLVTLVGPGGVGKTRLSVEVGRTLAEHFPDGVFFLDLAPLSNADHIPAALAALLKINDRNMQEEGLLTLIANTLKSRQLLLILDNCEHLLDACAHLSRHLFTACPQLQILATSRQMLGLNGEILWRVLPLGVPAEDTSPVSLSDYDATWLFMDRARTVAPSFTPDATQEKAICAICRRLDGIPFAIELAAARVRAMTPTQIEHRLSDRFRLLSTSDRTVLPRQQTLRALLDWSYDLLNEKERLLLARLGVFSGGWTLESAEAICPDPEPHSSSLESWEILDLLISLVDRSLVVFDGTGEDGNGGRYHLLDTVRAYAEERGGNAPELRDRHLHYFAERANFLETALMSGTEASTALRPQGHALFFGEEGNLLAARDWARQRGDHERQLLLTFASWSTDRLRGRLYGPRVQIEQALVETQEFVSPQTEGRARVAAGGLSLFLGDIATALNHYKIALVRFTAIRDTFGKALATVSLGICAIAAGDYRQGCDVLAEGVELFDKLDRPAHLAYCLYNLSGAQTSLQMWDAARHNLERCLVIRRQLNDRRGIGLVLNSLAILYRELDQLPEAYTTADEALQLWKELNDPYVRAIVQSTLAEITTLQGNYDEALALLRECIAVFLRLKSRADVFFVIENIALYLARTGDFSTAVALYIAVEEFRQREGLAEPPRPHLQERELLQSTMGEELYNKAITSGRNWDEEKMLSVVQTALGISLPIS